MNKKLIFASIIKEMEQTLGVLVRSAHEAREAATNEESKAENKYDTRGLEASYLAGAQAERATELQENLHKLSKLEIYSFNSESPLALTALAKVRVDGDTTRWFFLLPFAGGVKVKFQGTEIQTLSPQTPLGQKLIGSVAGDVIELRVGSKTTEYDILEIL